MFPLGSVRARNEIGLWGTLCIRHKGGIGNMLTTCTTQVGPLFFMFPRVPVRGGNEGGLWGTVCRRHKGGIGNCWEKQNR